jgi:hypothetical protein
MTDIDLSCDWQGRTFVFIELKYHGTLLTRGQQYHLEGLVKGLVKGGKKAIAILAHHEATKGDPIVAQAAMVNRVFEGDQWDYAPKGMSVKCLMDDLYQEHLKRKK